MTRETQDAQVAKQAREQIEFNAGAEAYRRGDGVAVGLVGSFRDGWMHAAFRDPTNSPPKTRKK